MYKYLYVFFLSILALHVSGAICTHPQEHKLQRTTIGVRNGFGMLNHWTRYWLGHPHTFSTVRFGQVWEGRAKRVVVGQANEGVYLQSLVNRGTRWKKSGEPKSLPLWVREEGPGQYVGGCVDP
jgi:hypothetical protein